MKNSRALCLALLLLFSFLFASPPGISNNGRNKNKHYVTAGDRTYIIGTQNGNFSDMGRHVQGEMAGLWLHPIKLMDGFWAKLTDVKTGEESRLTEAVEFITHPYGNTLKYDPVLNGIVAERFQFCPDGQTGMVIHYMIQNTGTQTRTLNFEFAVKTDLSPVWLSEKIGITDREDTAQWNTQGTFFTAKDAGNSWYAVWGTTTPAAGHSIGGGEAPQKTKGKGATAASKHRIPIDANSTVTLTYVIAGSPKNEREAEKTYRYLSDNHADELDKKKKHYASIVQRARIKIPDRSLQKVYDWIKINTEWLIREVPGIGRGLGAGFMEYPWWFGCDNTYALQAVMATGDFDLAEQTLRLLKNQSMKANGNGRIIHEVSTNGVVYNPGNTQETAHFIMAVEELFRWTADFEFIREMYPVMRMGLQWLLSDMDQNNNLFPEGYGIMEVYGLNAELIDVAVYTQQALEATARVAGILNEPSEQNEYGELAEKLKAKINRDFWNEAEGSYCDFYGSRAQAIRAAEGAITQVHRDYEDQPWDDRGKRMIAFYNQLKNTFLQMPDASKGWITNKNWVINTPIEMGIAPRSKAVRLLDKIRKENTGEYGPYLSAVERDAMMTISTGVQAIAEYEYGRAEEAMWYVNRIVETFSRIQPGSITEMMPDYGNAPQAWTNYGIVVPLIQYVFGIRPDAPRKAILFQPNPPAGWENMSIDNLPVGTNFISFSRDKTAKGIQYQVTAKEKGWSLTLQLPETPKAKYYLNGNLVSFDPSGFRMQGTTNTLVVVP